MNGESFGMELAKLAAKYGYKVARIEVHPMSPFDPMEPVAIGSEAELPEWDVKLGEPLSERTQEAIRGVAEAPTTDRPKQDRVFVVAPAPDRGSTTEQGRGVKGMHVKTVIVDELTEQWGSLWSAAQARDGGGYRRFLGERPCSNLDCECHR
jgi:hypothetical protein